MKYREYVCVSSASHLQHPVNAYSFVGRRKTGQAINAIIRTFQKRTALPFSKNPVIARFFREIGRADELGSGVRKLMKYGKAYGGSDPELLEGDVFRIVIKTPEFERATGTPIPWEVTGEVKRLLNACRSEMSRRQLQDALGLKGEENFRKLYLEPTMEAGLVEMTIPDKPKSRLQKYRLTDAGKHLLKSIQE